VDSMVYGRLECLVVTVTIAPVHRWDAWSEYWLYRLTATPNGSHTHWFPSEILTVGPFKTIEMLPVTTDRR
jgi:hypothetical protein